MHLPLVLRIKSLWTPNKSGLWPEVYGWLGEYKVVLDKSGFSAYCVGGDWGLKFLSVDIDNWHYPFGRNDMLEVVQFMTPVGGFGWQPE